MYVTFAYAGYALCMQIIKKVKVDGLRIKDMWRYVENVVGPEVLSRQMPVRDAQDSDHDIEILLQQLVDKKPCLSKVLQLLR